MKNNLINMLKEKEIKRQITDYLRLKGWKVYRLNNAGIYNPKSKSFFFRGEKGLADLLALKAGFPCWFIETKSLKGKVSKEQKEFQKLVLSSYNGWANVIHSLEEVMEIEKGMAEVFEKRLDNKAFNFIK